MMFPGGFAEPSYGFAPGYSIAPTPRPQPITVAPPKPVRPAVPVAPRPSPQPVAVRPVPKTRAAGPFVVPPADELGIRLEDDVKFPAAEEVGIRLD